MSLLARYGIRPTPLVRLERVGPPAIHLFAKCEWHLPTGSVKDRVAAAMFDAARTEGRLGEGARLLEPSSGNTGIALARLARLHRVPFTVLVPDNVSAERIEMLTLYGAEIEFTPGDRGSNGAVRIAEERAAATGALMLHQYQNRANPDAHQFGTGPEIETDLTGLGFGLPDVFVASLGTGGTLTGVGRHFAGRGTRIVAAEPPAGEAIAGLRSLDDGYIPPVFDPSVLDSKLLVRTGDAIAMTRRLLTEEGLFVGPSSGAAVHAAVRYADRLDPGSVVVVLLPDAGWKYLSTGIYRGPLDKAEERAGGLTLW